MKNKQLQTALIIGGSVLVGLLLILIAYMIYKRLKSDDFVKSAQRELNKSNLTYSGSKYEQIASAIYQAMTGPGTNEETIYRNLALLKNQDDWLAVVLAFGTKDQKNLVEYLTDELDNTEKEKLNEILANFNEAI